MFDNMPGWIAVGGAAAVGLIAVLRHKEMLDLRALNRASKLVATPLHDHEADKANGWVHAHWRSSSEDESSYEPGVAHVLYFQVNTPELLERVDQYILRKIVKDLRDYNLKVTDITIYDPKGFTEVQYDMLGTCKPA